MATDAGSEQLEQEPQVLAARLGAFDALLFAVVIETSLMQLRILEGSKKSTVNDSSIRITDKDIPLAPKEEKLLRDRRTVNGIMRATFAELLQGGRYTGLQVLVRDIQQQHSLAAALDAQRAQLAITRTETLHECRLQRLQQRAACSAADVRAATLRDALEDEAVNCSVRLGYVERWQRARAELSTIVQPICTFDSRKLQHEDRVHNEINRAFDDAIQEYSASVKAWEEKYHADLADISVRLGEQSNMLKETIAKRTQLQELFDRHAGEMNAWLSFKRERAARLALEAQRAQAAVHIEAWWRGVMVRRGIGAFKNLRSGKKQTKQSNKHGKKNPKSS